MDSIFESVRYEAIHTTDTTTNVFYVIIFTSRAYKLQENTTIDGHFLTSGELVVKAQYIYSMQVDTNWYWDPYPQQHVSTV